MADQALSTWLNALFERPESLLIHLDSSGQILRMSPAVASIPEVNAWFRQNPFSSQRQAYLIPFGNTQLLTLNALPLESYTPSSVLLVGNITNNLDMQKNQFLSFATHELRTPISSIFSWAELLKNNMLSSADEKADACQIIYSEGLRLSTLLTKILHFFRLESGRNTPEEQALCVGTLVHKVVADLQSLADLHGISIFLEESENSMQIQGDPALLSIAISNLIENAILFSPKNGEVSIQIESTPKLVIVQITDTGEIPFPMDQIDVLLSPYHLPPTTLKKRTGIGLGLPMANQIIRMHGGQLEIKAGSPIGTKVRVSLTRASQTQ